MSDALFSFENRDIWVIGGAGYLGTSVVSALEKRGAQVLCADLGTKAAEAGFGPQTTPASLDASDIPSVEAFVTAQIAERGVPQGLVVMTYGSTAKTFDDLTAADFDQASHGNLTATFTIARAVGNAMAQRGCGSMVLFSSMYGTVSPDPRMYEAPMNPNPVEYGVGKAGIQQLARYLAVHYGPRGVRCNAISPGPFPNPTIQANQPAFIDRLAKKVPLGRVGQSPEIAGAVVFLLSDAASFITGQNLAVDGGWTIW